MASYEFELKQFNWAGQLKLEDITINDNKIVCLADNFDEAQLSINNVLDLMTFFREKDIAAEYLSGKEHFERQPLTTTEWMLEATQDALEVFLAEAYSRYSDATFREQTGIHWVIKYYLSAMNMPLFQSRFLGYFSALELMLAHVTPPAAEGPLAGLVHAVRKIPSIPTGTRDIAAARLAAPSLAERMIEFVRLTGIEGVTFQASYDERYRFDELLRIREEFRKKGFSPRYETIDSNIKRYGQQLKDLIRESIHILVTQL